MSKIDFEKIAQAAAGRILDLAQAWIPGGRVEGKEYLMINPNRPDQRLGSFKINIDTGQWADFAASETGGDIISFCKYVRGFSNQGEAAEFVAQALGVPAQDAQGAQVPARSKPAEVWKMIAPVPADAPPPFEKHFKLGKPSGRWTYKDRAGQVIGYVYRFETSEGKQIYPVTYRVNGRGLRSWRWKGFNKPRPLYGLDRLASAPGEQVVIVEGEKAAEAGRALFGDIAIVVTWHGGTENVKNTDFKPLKGRKVVIWPDADKPGIEAADRIAYLIKDIAQAVKIVNPPAQAPRGWDLADAQAKGWTTAQVIQTLQKNLRDPDPAGAVEPRPAPPVGPGPGPGRPPAQAPPPTSKAFNRDSYPFRILGYDGTSFYYLPDGGQQIVALTGEQHDKKHLSAYLAPIDFWIDTWTSIKKVKDEKGNWTEKRGGVDWEAVKRFLIWELQYKHGVYNGDGAIRGPGIWRDNKRYVIHLGDRLIVDGQVFKMSKLESPFIYERKRTKELQILDPLPGAEARALIDIVNSFSWAKEINGPLLAGWIVAGLMGGALPWRPHLWINGPQSCGKSSVLKDVVRRILGGCIGIYIEGATTEAGLRQHTNHCSFPILFDEAESNDRKGQVRMEQIIELMRSSASPDGGKLLKGTPRGYAQTYDVQSCFCLASVSNNSNLAADVARIVNLEMSIPSSAGEKWESLRGRVMDTLNPEFCGRFRARVFKMLPVIRENIDTFIKAVRDELDSQRYGDVYGVLLGAAYSIDHDDRIGYPAALALVKDQDWTEERAQKFDKDEIKAMVKILQRIITVKGPRTQDKTIWELLKICHEGPAAPVYDDFGNKDLDQLTKAEADQAVRRYGVLYKYEDGQPWVLIANNNIYIETWLKDTPFSPNWYKWLKRIHETIDGKEFVARPLTARVFQKGQPSARGVMIPYEIAGYYLDPKD